MGFGLGIICFTIACVLFGGLLGLLRGQNRSILRLVLVVISAVVAFFLRQTFVDMLLGFEVEGQSVSSVINEALLSSVELPQQIVSFINMIIEILIGTIVFILVFSVLNFLSWLIVFPILKIFVRPSKNGKKRGVGLIFGLVQGLAVAFLFCVPVTGFVGQFAKIADTIANIMPDSSGGPSSASVEDELAPLSASDTTVFSASGDQYVVAYEGESADDVINTAKNALTETLKGIIDSPVVKFYNSVGGWYFDALTTVTDEEGHKVNINTTTDVLVVMSELTTDVFDVEGAIRDIVESDADPKTVLSSLGDVLLNVDGTINQLDENGKKMFDDILDGVKELIAPEGSDVSPEIREALDNLTVENLNLESVGNAFHSLSKYVDNLENEEVEVNIELEDAQNIVEAIHENSFIMDMIGNETILEVDEEDHKTFTDAINNIEGITEQEKQQLLNMFKIN